MNAPIVHRPRAYLDLREPKKPMATRLSWFRRIRMRLARNVTLNRKLAP